MECPKCKSSHVVKNGSVKGIRKHLCRKCGFQFTRSTPRGKPLKTKILAVVLYMSGLSFNRIGEICSVSAQSVLNWIRKFAAEHADRPKSEGETVILELDELWHFLQKKSTNSGSGQLWIAFPVDYWIGNSATETPKPSLDF
jgi:transposase